VTGQGLRAARTFIKDFALQGRERGYAAALSNVRRLAKASASCRQAARKCLDRAASGLAGTACWPCPAVAESSPRPRRPSPKLSFELSTMRGDVARDCSDFAPRNIARDLCVNLDRGITSCTLPRARVR